jgi:site-specific recombinase XerD
MAPNRSLFSRRSGGVWITGLKALRLRGFAILLRRLEAKAGIYNFGPARLAHGCAQRLADAGQDAFLIRDALGHASVAT